MRNYFSLLTVSPAFDIDLKDLEKRYLNIQRACHPDKQVGKSPAERQQAALHSTNVNEAYEALKNPYSRARHLLALQDIFVGGDNDSEKPSPEVLTEIMEIREALEKVTSLQELRPVKEANALRLEELLKEISAAFTNLDWNKGAQATIRLGYLLKIEEEIALKIKKLQGT